MNEVKFAEVYNSISAHYGEFNITLEKSGLATYSLIIPSKLREIRPKRMNLPDMKLEEVNEVHEFISNKNKEVVINIAKQLLREGMSLTSIADITKLKLEEVKELAKS